MVGQHEGIRQPEASMAEPRLRLFCVECRPSGETQAHTFFVPASNVNEAIRAAEASARDTQAQGYDVADPFQDETNLEVRVGTFTSDDSTEIEFGDWSPFRH